ncbi:MAG TPA: hypothetical protein HA346_04175 [Thermoplasmata archaeon]|nr:hypothetical protein [Thermoplasmata archaeon]
MLRSAEIDIAFEKEEDAELVMQSLSPETKDKNPRSSVEIATSGKMLKLKIEAKDTPALRATCNSYLRWIDTAIRVNALASKQET